jgi:hypothetical protein
MGKMCRKKNGVSSSFLTPIEKVEKGDRFIFADLPTSEPQRWGLDMED